MSDTRLAFLLFVLALLMRAVFHLGCSVFGTDGGQFLYMAEWMSEGRFQKALGVTYHPLYPLLTAAARLPLGSTETAGVWVSMILGAASIVPLFLLARSIFGRPAAFLTGLIYAFHPTLVELHADVMSEATFCFFFFWAAWLCWRACETPSIALSILAGACAVCSYLTRPEGILAVVLVAAWHVAALVARRDRVVVRAGGTASCMGVMLLLAFPFLLWVRSTTTPNPGDRTWALSGKNTVAKSEEAMESPLGPIGASDQGSTHRPEGPASTGTWDTFYWTIRHGLWSNRYGKLLRAMGQMTVFILAPFFLLGFGGLGNVTPWKAAFHFSFPLGYLAGLTLALRTVPHSSMRYIVPAMSLLFPLAATGLLVLLRWLKRRWPQRRWEPAWLGLVAAMAVLLGFRSMRLQRLEQDAVREAATWIRAQNVEQARIYSTTDKIGFLTRGRLITYPPDWRDFESSVRKRPADFYVYFERDIDREIPDYLEKLRASGYVAPPVRFPDPPRKGVRTILVHPRK